MQVRRLVSAALTLALSVGLTVAVAGSAAASVDNTFFTMKGDAGDWITGGATYSFTPSNASFTAGGAPGAAGFSVTGLTGSENWTVSMAAPLGSGELVAGTTYTGAQRGNDVAYPHLEVTGDSRGCNTILGSFTVLQIARDPGTGDLTQFAATFEQHCEGGTAAARGSIYFHASIPYAPNASLTLGGMSQAPSGQPVALTGRLVNGNLPIASATISVSRDDGNGPVSLPDVTTGSDGRFTVSDTMPGTGTTWTVRFAGDSTVPPLTATRSVVVGTYVSTFAITAPTTGTRGIAYRVTAVLNSGGTVLPGVSVTVTRKDLAGTRVSTGLTTAAGAVSVRDIPAVGGPVTWTFAFGGDTLHGAVTSSKIVTIARSATALSIKASATIYPYGARATVTVHLGTTYNRRDVYIYARPLKAPAPKAPGTLIAHVKVNSLGNAVIAYTMRSRTTFTVRFAGDYRYLTAARAVSPYVRAKVAIALGGYYSRSGSTYLYHGKDPAQMITVAPNRSGQCFNTEVQAYQGGRWQVVAGLSCGTLDGTSHGYAILYSNRPIGILVRIRASVGNDSYTQTLGATSAWVYLKFT